ncbi:hypothetical protein BN946_scf184799.g36 [Trametes cinnabarina]|uniref:Uncharacterized protein n=1 Tax=Pycnoporus cinnabarinus TaxID=5643 RepID=A0A060S7T3_PYCCI|nr:hypothetical protein BN946_scf184799.g36 [Trametes cinnabarina]
MVYPVPGHAKVKLGWYDRESNNTSPVVADRPIPMLSKGVAGDETAKHRALSEPSSPLTPVESDLDDLSGRSWSFEEEQSDKFVQQLLASKGCVTSASMDVIEITSSESEPSSPVASAAQVFIEPPPLPTYVVERRKRAASTSGPTIASRKKPRTADANDPGGVGYASGAEHHTGWSRQFRSSFTAANIGEGSLMEDDSNAGSKSLVRALSQANRAAPIFTNSSGHTRKRVIESEPEDTLLSPASVAQPNPSLTDARTSSHIRRALPMTLEETSSQPKSRGPVPALPRTRTFKRARAEEHSDAEGDRTRHGGDAGSSLQDRSFSSLGRIPKKSKKGPPTLSNEEANTRCQDGASRDERAKQHRQEVSSVPERRQNTRSEIDRAIVKPSARNTEAPPHKIGPERPQILPSEISTTDLSNFPGAQESNEQTVVTIASAATNGRRATHTVPTTSSATLSSSVEGSSLLQFAMTGASISIDTFAPVPTSTSPPAQLLGMLPPAAPVQQTLVDEASQHLSARAPRLDLGEMTVNALFRQLSSALDPEERERRQEMDLIVQNLKHRFDDLEDELKQMKQQLHARDQEMQDLRATQQKERVERHEQATFIRKVHRQLETPVISKEQIENLIREALDARLCSPQPPIMAHPACGTAGAGALGASFDLQYPSDDNQPTRNFNGPSQNMHHRGFQSQDSFQPPHSHSNLGRFLYQNDFAARDGGGSHSGPLPQHRAQHRRGFEPQDGSAPQHGPAAHGFIPPGGQPQGRREGHQSFAQTTYGRNQNRAPNNNLQASGFANGEAQWPAGPANGQGNAWEPRSPEGRAHHNEERQWGEGDGPANGQGNEAHTGSQQGSRHNEDRGRDFQGRRRRDYEETRRPSSKRRSDPRRSTSRVRSDLHRSMSKDRSHRHGSSSNADNDRRRSRSKGRSEKSTGGNERDRSQSRDRSDRRRSEFRVPSDGHHSKSRGDKDRGRSGRSSSSRKYKDGDAKSEDRERSSQKHTPPSTIESFPSPSELRDPPPPAWIISGSFGEKAPERGPSSASDGQFGR